MGTADGILIVAILGRLFATAAVWTSGSALQQLAGRRSAPWDELMCRGLRTCLSTLLLLPTLLGCSGERAPESSVVPTAVADTSVAHQAPPDLSALSLAQLHDLALSLNARSRQLASDMQRDIDDTKRRLGSRVSDPSSNVEALRIRETWPPRIQATDAELRQVMEEIGKRCPDGATLNSTEQRCH